MDQHEDEEIKRHLDEVKLLDSDLFEQDIDADNKHQHCNDEPISQKRHRLTKAIVFLIAIMLLLTVVGPLAKTFNITTIDFLKKSYQLSQNSEIKEYKQAVVTIKAAERKGTGFNVSEHGLIVTNNHVIGDEKEVVISFPDGPTTTGKVIAAMPEVDLAILNVDNLSELPYLEVGRNYKIKEETIYFIGNPLMFNQIANEGQIIGISNSSELNTPIILIDAPIYKGNSGSPVINKDGIVIGVIYAKGRTVIDSQEIQVGYAIPIDVLPLDLID